MAAPPLRWLIRSAVAVLAVLVLVVLGYLLAGWIGSNLVRNSDFVEAAPGTGVTIMLESNGTHTGIVVPVVNSVKDWRDTFPSAARPRAQDGRYPTHLGIGWGEREVFLSVPTWGDLEAGTALRVAAQGGDALVRVSHYVNPRPGENYRPIRISTRQYAILVDQIEAALPALAPGAYHRVLRGTYAPDAYYEATGTYTLIDTCNSWVGDTLAAAGVRMGAWTPFAGGVAKWIAPPQPDPEPDAAPASRTEDPEEMACTLCG